MLTELKSLLLATVDRLYGKVINELLVLVLFLEGCDGVCDVVDPETFDRVDASLRGGGNDTAAQVWVKLLKVNTNSLDAAQHFVYEEGMSPGTNPGVRRLYFPLAFSIYPHRRNKFGVKQQ